jgi:hypothetical protein
MIDQITWNTRRDYDRGDSRSVLLKSETKLV